MHAHPRILEFLSQSKDRAADQAIGAAIPHVDPLHQLELIEILLQREIPEGLAVLPEVFDQVGESGRARIISGSAKLYAALRASIRSPRSQTRLNALEIIRRGANPRLAYLAAMAIHDGAAKIRAEAAETIRRMAEQHVANHEQTRAILREQAETGEQLAQMWMGTIQMVAEERHFLLSALREALGSFESHHRPEVLEAAMLFADELEDVLFQGSVLLRGKLTHAMMEIIGDRLQPHLAPFAYVALAYNEIRRKIVGLLASCRDAGFMEAFIRYHWLAKDPSIARHLAAVRSLEILGDGFEFAFTLPVDVAVMAPSWLADLGIAPEQKVSVLNNFLLLDNPAASRAAIWAMTRIQTPMATLALEAAMEHEDEHVRVIARREVECRRRRSRRIVRRTRTDRPQPWAQLLDAARLTETFDDLWLNFERIAPELGAAGGKDSVKFVNGLNIQLQIKLNDPNPADRIRALRLVSTLNLAEHFNREIFNLCNDQIVEVRAMAVRLLAGIGDTTSRRILERAIAHDVPTVQARAIESLEQMGELRNRELLLPLLESEDAHVRGAAVRVLLKLHVPQAASSLMAMLRDRRMEYRCTALWVIDQMRLAALAPRLREMAHGDPDPRIARTALQILKRLQRVKAGDTTAVPVVQVEASAP